MSHPTTTTPARPLVTRHRVAAARSALAAAARGLDDRTTETVLNRHVDPASLLTPEGEVDVDKVAGLVSWVAALTSGEAIVARAHALQLIGATKTETETGTATTMPSAPVEE